MLIGEYSHTIDAKKRLAVPSKLRKELGERAVLTRGLDTCLFLYPEKEWQKLTEKLGELPVGQASTRSFLRLMLAGAIEVELDQLGRILLPDYLKEYAGLKQKVVITGVYNRLEIWDEERWGNYKGDVEKNTDMIAEKLGELGLY
ncbi:MAG: Protein MraZ [Parcubacteria group bacterium GW2011_GWB1_50_9]|uniref:Transcriptional regulator MraZ n=1 Tax=Candidatus Adlerbacteria bacterium GW2011_GWC1_50_9 TaxID=1618608 RepID=A0A0G1Z125_9BACT|nr:MAG: Protein MraZ [Parcubacteria group bacterium GW2011_GWB1_50_9]KKW21022.1 MAG: Protein mraZ [Candidatus Adlerbacteria bacterium GW2011_GWC1_50_9]KKW32395.1 MAG: Protein MraZ [Parcubacteria group bacterium GW2011_GWA1_53_13]